MRKSCLSGVYLLLIFFVSDVRSQVTILSENFNGAVPGWTTFNNSTGGNIAEAAWTLRPNGYSYTSIFVDPPAIFHSNDNSQFYLSNSDAQEGDVTETILQSPSFSTVGYSTVTLQFYHHFREYQTDTGYIEVSANGTNWTIVDALYADPEDSIGAAGAFVQQAVNLNAYNGNATFYIRFRYHADFGYYWAIDNVSVVGNPLLSVNLVSFSGYRDGSGNNLKWITANEQNNRGFQVERSIDGIHYDPAGFVNSLAPAGNSNSSLVYTFTDNNITGNKQFYRLRQFDIDGREKLSNIVLIKGIIQPVVSINSLFPNPATTGVQLIVNSPKHQDLMLIISDMNGRLMLQRKIIAETGANAIPVAISALANGTYYIKLVSPGGDESAVTKFIKQ